MVCEGLYIEPEGTAVERDRESDRRLKKVLK